MDLSKLSLWQKIILGAGILLFINLFLPWYRISFASIGGGSVSANAFDAGFLAWFGSFLGIAAAVLIAVKVFANAKIEVGPLKAEHLALILGGLGTFFILLKLLVDNDFLFIFIFFGLILVAAITYASFMAMKEAGLDLPSADDFSGSGG